MQLILLGTGGPRPDLRRHGPALVIRTGGAHLLFDAGRGVVRQLVRAGVDLARVNPVFITHHHFDHIGDLGDVILTTWLQGRRGVLRIFGPDGMSEIVNALIDRVYAKDIEFRSKGEPAVGGWQPVHVEDVSAGLVASGDGWTVSAELVVHGHGFGIPNFKWVTLGYRLEAEGKIVAISGDTIECDGLDRLARGADVLVQCCYLADAEITDVHAERLAKFVHTSSSRVGKVASRGGVKTLVLTHFREKADTLLRAVEDDVRRDFSGRLVMGEDLTAIDV